jgi:transposase
MAGVTGGSDLPDLSGRVPATVPQTQRDVFLRLPEADREIAVSRLAALAEFSATTTGKTALAGELAKQLGMSRSRFYQLAKAWEETGSIDAVVPYAAAKVANRRRSSRMDEQRLELLQKTIISARRRNPVGTKANMFNEVERVFSEAGLPAPSFSTVSRAFDGSIEATSPYSPQRRLSRLREPKEYGAALAIDHAELFLSENECLTATLVIDAFTGTIVGIALGHGLPDVRSAASALLSAMRKPLVPPNAFFAEGKAPPPEALLVMNVDKGRDWRKFASIIEDIDGGIDARTYATIVTGTFAFAIIGKRIGHYDLRYRRLNRSNSDDSQWAPVRSVAIVRSVEAAVREFNRVKLAVLTTPTTATGREAPPPLLFGVRNTELQDYLEELLVRS